jgi:uncharacterized protein (TIGR02147 family)
VTEKPIIYDYFDYRVFLRDSLSYIQSKNPMYTAAAFVKQAGFGENSRGYLTMIINKKRNLSSSTILGFTKALKLTDKEAYYFENLVLFNQANTEKDKKFYFERIEKSQKGKQNKAFEILKSQYNYFSNWYMVAIRELVAIKNFEENTEWIQKKLRGKVSKKEIQEAISDLLLLGLLKRNQANQLIQSDEFVRFSDDSFNYTIVNKIHSELLDRAKENLSVDPYHRRSASSIVFAANKDNFENIREDIKIFRAQMMSKYAPNSEELNSVLNLSIQLNFLTTIE